MLLAPATKRNFSPSLFLCFPPLLSVHTFRTESAGQYLRPNPSHYLLLLFLLPGMLVRQGAHQTTKKGMSLIPVTPCSQPHEHWSWFHVDGSRLHDTLVLGSMLISLIPTTPRCWFHVDQSHSHVVLVVRLYLARSFSLQELESVKEENSKLKNMRTDMDDELHQLTENLFEVSVCMFGGGEWQ